MADHQIFQTLKQSFSLAEPEIDSDMEFNFINNNLSGLYQNTNVDEDYSFNFHNSIIFPQLSSLGHAHGSFENGGLNQPIISTDGDHRKQRKIRKATEHLILSTPVPEMISTCSYSSSPQVSDCGTQKKNRGKKGRCKGEEKPREVIHVRARRGQATDSHSLAERVRRGKINERLRCLQDIVPGCYKTMGMAVMLDEIINYVQSLQNQVEFLSMKLTAASTFYDFNADTDAMEEMQRANALEAMKGENNNNNNNINIVAKQGVPLPYAQLGHNLGCILSSASTHQMKNED